MPTLNANGLEIHYRERGDGPTVLALHPATVSGRELGWLANTIVHEQGFNMVMPDLRGHGETPNPAGDLHMPRLVDDMLEFIYQLGRTPLHGFGYSLGGGVLLNAARRKPDLFRSLAVLGTGYRAPAQDRIREVLGPLENRREIEQQVFNPETGAVVGWDKDIDAFAAISCPTLIMIGDRDEFNNLEDNMALYRTLPNARLLVVPDTDHLELVRHPLVLEALSQFFKHVPR